MRTILLSLTLSATLLLLTVSLNAQPGRHRAVLVGIDDYSASQVPRSLRAPKVEDRGWQDLRGAARDAGILKAILILLYDFEERDIVLLTNQQATREAIVQSIDQHLVKPAQKGDVVLFYFAGHGSRVPNSESDELDRLDESIVPADSRRGAPDIRDKELRKSFNAILSRGASLTVLLDHCYSGSSFRGLPTGALPRGIRQAPVDIKDSTHYGPRPEDRGAIVMTATQDFDSAWETRDANGQMHGVFSWALFRAIRDAAADESAQEVFLRTQARMRAERPDQQPALAGGAAVRLRPFLGTRKDRPSDRTVVAIRSVDPDRTVQLQGGWVNGLTVGSQLRLLGDSGLDARLIIKTVDLQSSTARIDGDRALPNAFHSGALLEIVGWSAPPARPLRVWAPQSSLSAAKIASLGKRLAAEAEQRKIRWIVDPTMDTPTHVLRPARNARWELLTGDGRSLALPSIETAIMRIPAKAALFVQLPPPSGMESGSDRDGITWLPDALEADYILTGHYSSGKLEYSWIRPYVEHDDHCTSGMPQRTAWVRENLVTRLTDALLKLRRIHGWHHLESPPGPHAPYRLALRGKKANDVIDGKPLIGGDEYSIVLVPTNPRATRVPARYYYAFVIDSNGRSFLAFPDANSGSVENRFPISDPQRRIEAGKPFEILEPYGIDTYFLLSTDEPLPNPAVLEWDGIRTPEWSKLTALEELILLTIDPSRAATHKPITAGWSLEKIVFKSVEPRRSKR